MYDMDMEKAAVCVTDHCQHARVKAKMARPARSACHDFYQIFQVLSLHIPQWNSNNALILWHSVSG